MRVVGLIVFAMAVVLAACSGNGTVPATAPPTTVTSSSSVPMTTSDLPTTTTTTSTVDRVAEIEAILLDLDLRRITAVVNQDLAAYEAVYANAGFLQRAMEIFKDRLLTEIPTFVEIEVEEVLVDTDTCIAVIRRKRSNTVNDGDWDVAKVEVVELRQDGQWGLSFRGKGWACEGPHPFSES